MTLPMTMTQNTIKNETPFFPFKPKFPDFKGDMAFTGSNYFLLSHSKETTIKTKTPEGVITTLGVNAQGETGDPVGDKKVFIPFLTLELLRKIQFIAEVSAKQGQECAWMFLARPIAPNSPHYLFYDYFLAGQDATGAHVSLDLEDVARYTEYLKNTYPDDWGDTPIADQLHHGHVHPNMACFWSSTDEYQQTHIEDMGYQNTRRFFLVFNNRKEVYASLVNYSPVFYRMDNIPVGIYTGDACGPQNEVLTQACKKEIQDRMATLIRRPVSFARTWMHENKGFDSWLKEPYDFADNRKVSRRKPEKAEVVERSVGDVAASVCMEMFARMELDMSDNVTYLGGEAELRANEFLHEYNDLNFPELDEKLEALDAVGFFDEVSFEDFVAEFAHAFYPYWEDTALIRTSTLDVDLTPPLGDVLSLVLEKVCELADSIELLSQTVFWDGVLSPAGEEFDRINHLFSDVGDGLFDFIIGMDDLVAIKCTPALCRKKQEKK